MKGTAAKTHCSQAMIFLIWWGSVKIAVDLVLSYLMVQLMKDLMGIAETHHIIFVVLLLMGLVVFLTQIDVMHMLFFWAGLLRGNERIVSTFYYYSQALVLMESSGLLSVYILLFRFTIQNGDYLELLLLLTIYLTIELYYLSLLKAEKEMLCRHDKEYFVKIPIEMIHDLGPMLQIDQLIRKDTQSKSNNTQADPEITKPDPNNTQLDSKIAKPDTNNTQVDPEIAKPDPNNTQADPEIGKPDLNNTQADPRNTQEDPEIATPGPKNTQTDSLNSQAVPQNT